MMRYSSHIWSRFPASNTQRYFTLYQRVAAMSVLVSDSMPCMNNAVFNITLFSKHYSLKTLDAAQESLDQLQSLARSGLGTSPTEQAANLAQESWSALEEIARLAKETPQMIAGIAAAGSSAIRPVRAGFATCPATRAVPPGQEIRVLGLKSRRPALLHASSGLY